MSSPSQIGPIERVEWTIEAGEAIVNVHNFEQLRCTQARACCIEIVIEVFASDRSERNSRRGASHRDTVLQCLCQEFAPNRDTRFTITLEAVLSEEAII